MAFARGADFSSFQDDAAMTAALHRGLHFGIVKATEGVDYTNPRARTQVARLETSGAHVALYHFLRHDVDGARQWDYFEAQAGHWGRGVQGRSYPVACDQETDRGVLVPDHVARAFIRRGQQRGWKVGRYGDARVMGRGLGEDWRWYARWAGTPPRGRWDIWQFSSAGGQDWNVFHGDALELARWWTAMSSPAKRKRTPPRRWWLRDELHARALGPYRLPAVPAVLLAYAARHPKVARLELVRK